MGLSGKEVKIDVSVTSAAQESSGDSTSNLLLGWICAQSFMSNVMYDVLYALSELFATRERWTGNAIVAPIRVARVILVFCVAGCHSNLPGRRRCSRVQTLTIFIYDLTQTRSSAPTMTSTIDLGF